jgi:hypothetical protein
MWGKARKLRAALAPLAAAIDGEFSDGAISGSYRGFAVQARPHRGYPIKYASAGVQGGGAPEPVNMLQVVLTGVGGSQVWHCQSSASSYLQDLTSRFTSGPLLNRFAPGQFKFQGVDTLNDSMERMGEKLVKHLGMPMSANADPALQERLIAAGLFDELEALRLGGHPYLPKVQFVPGARSLAAQYLQSGAFARGRPAVEERLRAAGMGDYESLMAAKLAEAEKKSPGRLELDVEAGRAEVLGEPQFREVLAHAAQIAQINAEVNRPAE